MGSLDGGEIGESDCCGNGCANCILDSKLLSSRNTRLDLSNKNNVLHNYRKYKLIQRIDLLRHVIQLKFNICNEEQLTDFIFDCPPGHHVMMRAPDLDAAENYDKKYLLRPYSPFWTDITAFQFEILVNLNPNGKMTKYIENLQLDDQVEFRGPLGNFLHEPSGKSNRVLIVFSHGVAIAPTIPIVQSILDDEEDMTRIYHYSCFQNVKNILFRDQLMEFNKFWNFSSRIYFSRQECDECTDADCEHFKIQSRYKEQLHPYRLESDNICRDLERIGSGIKEIVICGSKRFQDFIQESLNGCNVNKENIFVL